VAPAARAAGRPLENLYPPARPPKPYRRGVLDDTLDAQPPYHLLRGRPTREAIEAAKRLAAEYGYPLPELPADERPPAIPKAPASRSRRIAEGRKK